MIEDNEWLDPPRWFFPANRLPKPPTAVWDLKLLSDAIRSCLNLGAAWRVSNRVERVCPPKLIFGEAICG